MASIFSLVLIACDRFFGIVFAMKAHIIERSARYSIIAVWICALAVAIPLLVVRKTYRVEWANHVEIWCDDDWPSSITHNPETGQVIFSFPGRKAYYLTVTIALCFVPLLMMSTMYSLIIATVWFARTPGEQVSGKDITAQRRVKRKVRSLRCATICYVSRNQTCLLLILSEIYVCNSFNIMFFNLWSFLPGIENARDDTSNVWNLLDSFTNLHSLLRIQRKRFSTGRSFIILLMVVFVWKHVIQMVNITYLITQARGGSFKPLSEVAVPWAESRKRQN